MNSRTPSEDKAESTSQPQSPTHIEKKRIRGQDVMVHYASSKRIKKVRPSALRELLYASCIYGLCVTLPAIISFLVRSYQSYMLDQDLNPGGDVWSLRHNYSDVLPQYLQHHFWSQMHNDTILHFQHWTSNVFNLFHHTGEIYIETKAMSDLQFIIRISIILTVIRVIISFVLVPRYQVPRRLAAFARCKSTHLLSSSEYSFNKKRYESEQRGIDDTHQASVQPNLSPSITSTRSSTAITSSIKSNTKKLYNWITDTINHCRRSLTHDIKTPYESLDATQALRLFSAPRYATAIFRFLYCSSSCIWAYYKLKNANFWPIWLGGQRTATTLNCWDLRGSLVLDEVAMLHSDFDHQDTTLRYFILTQASYQIHSVMFHVFTLVLMVTQNGVESGTIWSSMKSYLRPLVEHTLYFILIMVSFIFSGLRRLGTVAIFALEASSLFLQVLQICINAPQSSLLRNPRTIVIVHRYVVIPVFVYYRMFVFPFIIQYSAGFESIQWYQQLEHVLIPGCGKLLYLSFNAMLAVTFMLNIVYLKRLMFHPYVQNIVNHSQK